MFERMLMHFQRSLRLKNIRSMVAGLALVSFAAASARVGAEDPTMRIRLKDSSFSIGRVVASDAPNTLGWQTEGFENPFLFDVRSVQSIGLIASEKENPAAKQGQYFELQNGAMISGNLKAMDAEWITVQSDLLGEVRVARQNVLSLVDAGYAGELIYSGPRDDKSWVAGEPVGAEANWDFEAGMLVAKRQGIAIVGKVDLPAKSQIALTMSWKGSPDFVLSLGTSESKSPSASEPVLAAARLEVWDKQLALLREVDDSADIELLAELAPSNPRIELTVYLDQDAGTVIVCDAHGRPLDRMTLPSKKKTSQPAVQLVNHGPSLTLERFEVRAWDGVTTIGGNGSGVVVGDSNEVIPADIVGFDAETQELQLESRDGKMQSLPIAKIRRGDFGAVQNSLASEQKRGVLPPAVVQPPQPNLSKPNAAKPKANGTTQETADGRDTAAALADHATSIFDSLAPVVATPTQENDEPALVEVVWTDRTRLKGLWLPSVDGKLRFEAKGLAAPFLFEPHLIRGIIGTVDRFSADLSQHRNGTMKIGETELSGFLEENSTNLGERALYWHPHGSRTAAGVNEEAQGAIIYRKPLPKVSRTKKSETNQDADAIAGPIVQIFLGGNRQKDSDKVKPSAAIDSRANAKDEREIVFRSGDAIDGVVKRIDENGIQFESSESQTTRATHEQMQSVWLNRQRRELEVSPEKLTRLMTVPRSMKADPPTHLFISVLGDFLRGRLVSLDEKMVTVEVRLEMIELQRDQVAQIIWLHDRDWSNDKKAQTEPAEAEIDKTAEAAGDVAGTAASEPFRVHVIKATGRGLTFEPDSIRDGVLSGTSDLLGACTVEVSALNQLLFGRNIAEQLREYADDPWKLSLAQYPRVFLEDENAESGAGAGSSSPMVGELATDFGLKTLEGETFRLSKSRDRVVVLDFWASWCGPCIQTMPMVEEVVQEIGGDKVHLVAVNIQEAPTKVQAAVDRLGLKATVLLDRDGEAAAAYAANAIPQTVIIDKEGKVTHVFVGGGSRFVAQFRKALEEVTK